MLRRIWTRMKAKRVLLRTPRRHTRSGARSPLPRYAISVHSTPLHRLNRMQPSVPGALSIDAVCQEGAFVVENVSFYNDGKLATDLTAEADWKRRGLYIGPQVCLLARCRRHTNVVLNELLCPSSRPSTSAFRRSLRSSSRSVVSMRISHSSFPSTRSTKNKKYVQF